MSLLCVEDGLCLCDSGSLSSCAAVARRSSPPLIVPSPLLQPAKPLPSAVMVAGAVDVCDAADGVGFHCRSAIVDWYRVPPCALTAGLAVSVCLSVCVAVCVGCGDGVWLCHVCVCRSVGVCVCVCVFVCL